MNVYDLDPLKTRELANDVHPMFLERWSPRAMNGSSITGQQIATLIEAARWAPSCFNAQPWRFAYVIKGSTAWDRLYQSLAEVNQGWVSGAGAMIAIASRKTYEHNDQPAPTHSFDTGAAWMSIAFAAQQLGLVAHGMAGFDQHHARDALTLPEHYDLPAIIAIGHPGEIEALPENYREREHPSARKPLNEILFQNNFDALI